MCYLEIIFMLYNLKYDMYATFWTKPFQYNITLLQNSLNAMYLWLVFLMLGSKKSKNIS